MNKQTFLKFYNYLQEIPEFKCPSCDNGVLIPQKDKFLKEKTLISRRRFEILANPEDIEYHFTSVSICNNNRCYEPAVISGTINLVQNGCEDTYDKETGEEFDIPDNLTKYEERFMIKNVSIPLYLISLPDEIDKELKFLIEQSFNLFWVDEASCANKIRIALEYLLKNKLHIPNRKKCRDKKKSTPNHPVYYWKELTLGDKLGELKGNQKLSKYKYLADNMKAIKWVGNEGSHYGRQVNRERLMEAYHIVAHVLEEIYSSKKKNVKRITTKINNKFKKKNKVIKTIQQS
ncbi:MAG: DUF4145 domain-containing protein [Bacteroidetes bacterium]|nr:DUF4145 domain-containing protein [Bacteroidota bacterium]